jgi:3-hydroxyacyl-CoA dehydrogenase
MTQTELEQKLSLVIPATDYEAFRDVDIILEAVPEKMDLKKKVFQDLEKRAGEGAIFASNTSALSISEMASATQRPQKVIGMHVGDDDPSQLFYGEMGLKSGQDTRSTVQQEIGIPLYHEKP